MYLAVFSALLCISSGAPFIGHSQLRSALTGEQTPEDSSEYPTSQESSKRVVLEPPLIKRGIDPLSIPRLIREPPLKRGDKRDSYVYPSTSLQVSDRVPLREPPLKRSGYESEPEMDLSGTVYLLPFVENALWQEGQNDEDSSESDIFVRPSSKRTVTSPRRNAWEQFALRRPLLGPSLVLPVPQRQLTTAVHTKPLSLTRLWR